MIQIWCFAYLHNEEIDRKLCSFICEESYEFYEFESRPSTVVGWLCLLIAGKTGPVPSSQSHGWKKPGLHVIHKICIIICIYIRTFLYTVSANSKSVGPTICLFFSFKIHTATPEQTNYTQRFTHAWPLCPHKYRTGRGDVSISHTGHRHNMRPCIAIILPVVFDGKDELPVHPIIVLVAD